MVRHRHVTSDVLSKHGPALKTLSRERPSRTMLGFGRIAKSSGN
jgi:hypothetical protein